MARGLLKKSEQQLFSNDLENILPSLNLPSISTHKGVDLWKGKRGKIMGVDLRRLSCNPSISNGKMGHCAKSKLLISIGKEYFRLSQHLRGVGV